MQITTKTSPQGVGIEFIEYTPATTGPRLQHLSRMTELNREARNRIDARKARVNLRELEMDIRRLRDLYPADPAVQRLTGLALSRLGIEA